MSRLIVQVSRREETSVATAIVEMGPDRPVRYAAPDRVLEGVLKFERPLPLATLVRQVLTRYGLEPAAETDCSPQGELEVIGAQCDRGGMRA